SRQGRGEERFHEGPYEETFYDDYDNRYTYLGDPERYPAEMGNRPGEVGEPGELSLWGSSSALPPGGERAYQYEGADRRQFRGDEYRQRGGQDRYQRGDRQAR